MDFDERDFLLTASEDEHPGESAERLASAEGEQGSDDEMLGMYSKRARGPKHQDSELLEEKQDKALSKMLKKRKELNRSERVPLDFDLEL